MKYIQIINGPNINLTGKRDLEHYGTISLSEIISLCQQTATNIEVKHMQSNHEGELIDTLHKVGYDEDCIVVVINGGGYSHTSIALADAIEAIPKRVIEVHMSNIFAREPFRHISLISKVCNGSIVGGGGYGYVLAVTTLIERYNKS